MTSRILKAFAPIFAILAIGSVAISASANEAEEDLIQGVSVTSPLNGAYSRLSFYRDDDYASVSLLNKTNTSRYIVVSLIGMNSNGIITDTYSNAGVRGYWGNVSTSGYFSDSTHYVLHSGTLYNGSNSASGPLETLRVRSTPDGTAELYP